MMISRQQAISAPISVPSPIGGWNTRDALDAMEFTDAVLLDNWFPSVGSVKKRDGYAEHATGMGSGNVDTLAEYHAGTTRKLIAGANGNIYDATGTPSSLGSGFTRNNWQTQNFNGRLFLVNGADAPQDYDGTTLSATAWTGSGLTISDLVGVNAYKNRLYMWEEDSQDFWYAAPAAITGSLTKFPLSRVGQFGGNLIAMGTWTHDGGDGADDYAVFIMSSGDVIVYSGSDPGDATDFLLVGVYHIGVPLGIRGVVKVGGDLMIMTTEDYVSLSAVLRTGQLGTASKLSGAVITASANASLFGWQALVHRKGQKILFNVPTASNQYQQHVINAITGAPTRFVDIPARCWAVCADDLYFGSTDGAVYKISGNEDNGAAIQCDGRQAWSAIYNQNTRITAARPVLETEGPITYEFAIGADFQTARAPAAVEVSVSTTPWGSPWGSPWGAENVVSIGWNIASALGQNFSPRLRVNSKHSVSWLRTDYRAERGTNL